MTEVYVVTVVYSGVLDRVEVYNDEAMATKRYEFLCAAFTDEGRGTIDFNICEINAEAQS